LLSGWRHPTDAAVTFDAGTPIACSREHCPIKGKQAPVENLLDAVQWPAMLATLVAAWLVAAQSKGKRNAGFWCFMGSNVLWVVWGWHDHAYALIALQLGLLALNVRGAMKNEPQEPGPPGSP
jgi:hypothetical protein